MKPRIKKIPLQLLIHEGKGFKSRSLMPGFSSKFNAMSTGTLSKALAKSQAAPYIGSPVREAFSNSAASRRRASEVLSTGYPFFLPQAVCDW